MIILLICPGLLIKSFNFDTNSSITVGSDYSCDIVINYPFISPIHCTFILMCDDREFYYLLWDGAVIKKKHSITGTWVNDNPVLNNYRVKNKDRIYFHEEVDNLYLILLEDESINGG